jgi:S1-C subfamily serine protease
VSPGGPAEEAGVKAGDVIVAIEAKPVTTGRELVRAMEAIEPGEKVQLGLKRDGKPAKLAVEARELDRVFFAGTPALPGLPAMPVMHEFEGDMHWLLGGWSDAELVTLTPDLGRYFGADKGVLVARAPGEASFGLKDGDVIVSIGGREPQSGTHAMRILRSYQPGESVELKILRDRRAQTLNAKVPERAKRDVLRFAAPPKPPAPPPPPREPAAT